MSTTNPGSDTAWAIIENERRRDRFIRRVNVAAWTVTFVLVLFIAGLVGLQLFAITGGSENAFGWLMVAGSMMPLIDVLWKLSLLVAGLSTVGIFLRLRTASLTEIQLRLAALEQILKSRPDSAQGGDSPGGD